MSAYFRPIIMNAFPKSTWDGVVRCAAQGVGLADDLLRQERWLNWAVGKDQRGDLRRVGVMWSLREACAAGDLPFACEDRTNSARNCHHIEIRSQNLYLHVNRTENLLAMPRDTKFRNDERASNQLDLLKPVIFTTKLSEIKTWYGWMTFNADTEGRLTHLAIGLPEMAGNDWLDIVPMPLRGSGAFVSEDDEPAPPGPDQLVKFKEDIKKLLRIAHGQRRGRRRDARLMRGSLARIIPERLREAREARGLSRHRR